jgi:hypothetical protein
LGGFVWRRDIEGSCGGGWGRQVPMAESASLTGIPTFQGSEVEVWIGGFDDGMSGPLIMVLE